MKNQVYHEVTVTKGDATVTLKRPWFGYEEEKRILAELQAEVYKLYVGKVQI